MYNLIKLNKNDNVAVVPMNIPIGKEIDTDITSKNNIPFGHKIALSKIEKTIDSLNSITHNKEML